MRFYSDWEKREGIKQAKPQRMFSWTITWEDIQLFESEKEDELGNNSVTRLGQLLEMPQLGSIKETCFWCINDVPDFFPNGAALYKGTIQLDNNYDENLTDTSSDDEVEQAFNNAIKYELHLHRGLRELDKDEWVSFWRRYNLIQFWSAGSNEEVDGVTAAAVVNREEIKELYPGMEDIVDILLDNNVPFSHEGVFELTNDDNEVIASAAMIIDNPKIVIDPFTDNDQIVFEQNGYKVIKQNEFNVELINKSI
jgi:DEAD/DEAH box helicase domain-containing protein